MSNKIIPSKEKIKTLYESYNNYFNKVMENVISILHEKVSLMAQPTYKFRVKSFNSYYKKILRLKSDVVTSEKNTEDSLIYLTDIMGIRMICAFLEDINIGLDQIKKIFKINTVNLKILKQIQDYQKEYNFTYKGIKNSLQW